MTTTFTSALKVGEDITTEPVPGSDFIPDSGNLYPKWGDKFSKAAVEVWLFDAITENGSNALTISFIRDSLAAPAGFRIGINANWADGTIWGNPLVFPESVITSEGSELGRGRVTGAWRTDKDNTQASFEVAPDLSSSIVKFDVPGKITGTIAHRSLGYPGLPKTKREAQMSPEAYWMRPIAMADVTVDITFYSETPEGQTTSKRMTMGKEQGATGGVDRSWEPMPWTKAMTDSLFLRVRAGPYVLQVMRLVGRPENNYALTATARLYCNGKLVCAPLQALQPNEDVGDDDAILVEKLYEGGGVPATFRNKNVGYRIEFCSARQRWSFEVRHRRPWYCKPTSPPGPNATGNSGFVVAATGGLIGSTESFQGWGIEGQVDTPDN